MNEILQITAEVTLTEDVLCYRLLCPNVDMDANTELDMLDIMHNNSDDLWNLNILLQLSFAAVSVSLLYYEYQC